MHGRIAVGICNETAVGHDILSRRATGASQPGQAAPRHRDRPAGRHPPSGIQARAAGYAPALLGRAQWNGMGFRSEQITTRTSISSTTWRDILLTHTISTR